jgi:hypothetical protein
MGREDEGRRQRQDQRRLRVTWVDGVEYQEL